MSSTQLLNLFQARKSSEKAVKDVLIPSAELITLLMCRKALTKF